MPANLENAAVVKDWKRIVFIPIQKKDNVKECSMYHTTAFIWHASKVMLKILQARLQQHVNWELPDVQDGFRKGKGTRDQIANICWIIKKGREFQKNTYFYFIYYTKAFDCILSPCLFNLYAEYIIWNAGLDEAQAGIKIARRKINNLTNAGDTVLMAGSEEELKSLLKVKEES